MTAKRIFNDPDHPQYGPVRRMWVILAQLGMLKAAERYSRHYGLRWDILLAAEVRARKTEDEAQRAMLLRLMEGWV